MQSWVPLIAIVMAAAPAHVINITSHETMPNERSVQCQVGRFSVSRLQPCAERSQSTLAACFGGKPSCGSECQPNHLALSLVRPAWAPFGRSSCYRCPRSRVSTRTWAAASRPSQAGYVRRVNVRPAGLCHVRGYGEPIPGCLIEQNQSASGLSAGDCMDSLTVPRF
jgi:hypothetical protein